MRIIHNERFFLGDLAPLLAFPFGSLSLVPLPLFALFDDFPCLKLASNMHALYPQSFRLVGSCSEWPGTDSPHTDGRTGSNSMALQCG